MATQIPSMGQPRPQVRLRSAAAYQRAHWLDIGGVYLFLIVVCIVFLGPVIRAVFTELTTKTQNLTNP